jgi:hypothetical protein
MVPRSRRSRVGLGGQLPTRALGSSFRIGLPTDVHPVPSSRMVRPYAGTELSQPNEWAL